MSFHRVLHTHRGRANASGHEFGDELENRRFSSAENFLCPEERSRPRWGWKETLMKNLKGPLEKTLAVLALCLVGGGLAWAQDNEGMKVLQSIDGSVKSGWTYLKTAAALIVGGGFLAS